MTEEETRALFERVMDAMVRAGWLKAHTWTEGKGHHLVWNPPGAQRAILLKRVARHWGLLDADEAAFLFYVSCTGEALPGGPDPAKLEEPLVDFYRQCVRELSLYGSRDGLLAMVHIADGWAPDDGTRTVIDFGQD